MNPIFLGKNIFIRVNYILGFLLISNPIIGSNIGNKTTNIFKQNPKLDGYYVISDLEDISKSGYLESPLGYDNGDWFVKKL